MNWRICFKSLFNFAPSDLEELGCFPKPRFCKVRCDMVLLSLSVSPYHLIYVYVQCNCWTWASLFVTRSTILTPPEQVGICQVGGWCLGENMSSWYVSSSCWFVYQSENMCIACVVFFLFCFVILLVLYLVLLFVWSLVVENVSVVLWECKNSLLKLMGLKLFVIILYFLK